MLPTFLFGRLPSITIRLLSCLHVYFIDFLSWKKKRICKYVTQIFNIEFWATIFLKAVFHLVKISTHADFFRAENSAWKNFLRGQKKKKDIK